MANSNRTHFKQPKWHWGSCLIIAAALIPLSSIAADNYYKWVDAEGVTHYSQHPPGDKSIKKEQIKVSNKRPADAARAISELEANRKSLLEAAESRKKELGEGLGEAEKREAIKKNCKVAEDNLNQLKTNPRVREKGEDGEFRYLSEDEHEQRKDQNMKFLEKHCR